MLLGDFFVGIKNKKKFIYITIAILVNVVLWQNCGPSFEANSDFSVINIQDNDSTSPLTDNNSNNNPNDNNVTPPNNNDNSQPGNSFKVGFISPTFQSHYNTSTGELICNNPSSELEFNVTNKLSRSQLKDTLNEILGIKIDVDTYYPRQITENIFTGTNEVVFEDGLFLQLLKFSQVVADAFIGQLSNNSVWPCDLSDQCYRNIINNVPFYMYRRPLTTQENASVQKITSVQAANNAQKTEVIRNLIQYLITSPQFLLKNHNKLAAANIRNLDVYEYASKMSFFLKNSSPSIDLLNKIKSEEITSKAQLVSYARNLLNDKLTVDRLSYHFFGRWLKFDVDLGAPGEFDKQKISNLANVQFDRVKEAIQQNRSISSLITGQNSLLTSKYFAYKTFHTEKDSSPVNRGTYVLANIACFQLPNLSPATESAIEAVSNSDGFPVNGNNLEVLEFHRSQAQCAACHNYIDPLAIGLERFDAYGNYRESYPNGSKIEFNQKLAGQSYSSAADFNRILASTADYKACFTEHLHKSFMTTPGHKFKPCFNKSIFSQGDATGLKDIIINTLNSDNFATVKKPSY